MRMKMKSTIMCVFLLILVLLEMICCQGCWKHEREALLALNAQFDNPLAWGDNADCCKWNNVKCNTTTWRVEKLDLNGVLDSNRLGNWYINYSNFLVFEDLKSLKLSKNSIAGCVEHEGLRLRNLEVIDLSANLLNSSESILSCLEGLSSLKSLDLSLNGFNGTSLHVVEALSSKLFNLEVLRISGNDFNGSDVASSLGGLQHLKYLDLSQTHLEGSLNISGLLGLSNLEILDLGYNDISNFVVHQGSKRLSKLKVLKLNDNKMDGNMLRKSLRAFSSIRELDLSDNQFKETVVAADFRDLGNLENLVLDYSSNLVNEFFKSIGLLTSLKVLSMHDCHINGILLAADWYKLRKLEKFDLSFNEFEGPLPSSFCNMTSLFTLDLSWNNFNGNLDSNIESLTSLEYLDFSYNQIEFPISFTPFVNHSNIKFIYGNGSKVILDSHPTLQTWVPKFQLQELALASTTETNSLPLPNFLLYQYNLSYLNFTGLKLEGDFPNWLLENNTKITELILKHCSFTGTFQLPSRPLLSIRSIDVSHNAIAGQLPSSNLSSIFPNLQVLDISVNDIHGPIPHEFGQMSLLDSLDLSDNHLLGEIPRNISGAGSLTFLRLSNNKLDGTVFPTLSMHSKPRNLLLDGNSFSGSILSSSFNNISSNLAGLDISNNHFSGKLPSGWNQSLSSLMALSMSNNHFEGSIPSEFAETESLVYLDLSSNKLSGSAPYFLSSSMKFIHLNNNNLRGLPKRMFNNESSDLRILDLSNNHITGGIKDMIDVLIGTGLQILLLKGNHFTGQIPKQLCHLINITILDLSHNNFSGPIPNCLGKMPLVNHQYHHNVTEFTSDRNSPFRRTPHSFMYSIESPLVIGKASFTTKKSSYTYTGSILFYMTGIDLSFNKLNGYIPSELGNLTEIRAMNLSYNDLRGEIPATFSNLVQVESLDLSFNKLSGSIPPQLNELRFLEVFSVAHNNLSGAIPERKGQFLTFDESSYEGNPFLCGPPLQKSCNPSILPNGSYIDGDSDDSLVDIYVFWVSFAVSYASVLLGIAAVLYINPYWRRAWFYYIGLISTNCYYFIEDNLHKFSINI